MDNSASSSIANNQLLAIDTHPQRPFSSPDGRCCRSLLYTARSQHHLCSIAYNQPRHGEENLDKLVKHLTANHRKNCFNYVKENHLRGQFSSLGKLTCPCISTYLLRHQPHESQRSPAIGVVLAHTVALFLWSIRGASGGMPLLFFNALCLQLFRL